MNAPLLSPTAIERTTLSPTQTSTADVEPITRAARLSPGQRIWQRMVLRSSAIPNIHPVLAISSM